MESPRSILLPKYDPRDPETVDDPYRRYATLRRAGPLCRGFGPGHWAVTHYAEVAALLSDPRLGMESAEEFHGVEPGVSPLGDFFRNIVFSRDPPAHTRLRELLGLALRPAFLRRLEARLEARVEALIERLIDAGEFDAVGDLAVKVPMLASGLLFGIPEEDLDSFHAHARAFSQAIDLRHVPGQDLTSAIEKLEWLRSYLDRLVSHRRRRQGDDLLTSMIAADRDGDRLTQPEIIDNAIFVFFAGLATSSDLIATGCVALTRFPDAWAQLRANPSLAAPAIEEFLRYDAPIQALGRRALEPIEIAGRTIRPGRVVWLVVGSANHDERRFERPDRLVITRKPNPHLSFGSGAHYCLAAQFARAEAAMVFRHLAGRCAALAPTAPPQRCPSALFRSYERIPVRTAAA